MLTKQLTIIKAELTEKTKLTTGEAELLKELNYLDRIIKEDNLPAHLILDSANYKNESSLITSSGDKCPCCGN